MCEQVLNFYCGVPSLDLSSVPSHVLLQATHKFGNKEPAKIKHTIWKDMLCLGFHFRESFHFIFFSEIVLLNCALMTKLNIGKYRVTVIIYESILQCNYLTCRRSICWTSLQLPLSHAVTNSCVTSPLKLPVSEFTAITVKLKRG